MLFLPNELWLEIFEFISIKDMFNVLLVCQYFYHLGKRILHKKRKEYITYFSLETHEHIKRLLFYDNMMFHGDSLEIFNTLYKIINTNIEKKWFNKITSSLLAFILIEWDIDLKDEHIRYMIAMHRDYHNNWLVHFDNLNFYKEELIQDLTSSEKALFG